MSEWVSDYVGQTSQFLDFSSFKSDHASQFRMEVKRYSRQEQTSKGVRVRHPPKIIRYFFLEQNVDP